MDDRHVLLTDILNFVGLIAEENFLQAKYLKKFVQTLQDEELRNLRRLIDFYRDRGHSMRDIADAYLLFIKVVLEETLFFMQNGCYRYSTFREVADDVYFNPEYMKRYMMGLALSTYLLNFHIESMRWFREKIRGISGKRYLEIGPGHGEYFLTAMESSSITSFLGVDISQASVDMTRQYLEYAIPDRRADYDVICRDFFAFTSEERFDALVMGEVLEHVENPEAFLRQIGRLAERDAFIYVTTVINTPEKDHIYLFRTVDDVLNLVRRAGLDVEEYRLVTYNDKPLEKVVRNGEPILIAMILKDVEPLGGNRT